MSRRDQIRLSDAEVRTFLEEERTMTCATNGRDGWPHLMPLWYVPREDGIWAWTYATSQKVRNLERDRRATLQVEAGESYDELRGVMLRAEAVLHRDTAVVAGLGAELMGRYLPGADVREAVARQAPKRVAMQFVERSRVTWDHRKLAGAY